MHNPSIVFAGSNIRVIWFRTGSEKVIVTFDHWKRERANFEEFANGTYCTKMGFDHIHFQTSRNDWYINDEWGPSLESIASKIESYKASRCVGFSMGGIPALLSADQVGATSAVSISPRLPPATVSSQHHVNLLGGCAQSLIVFDPKSMPDKRAARFIALQNEKVKTIELVGGGHPAVGLIKRSGRKREALSIIIRSDNVAEDLMALHFEASRSDMGLAGWGNWIPTQLRQLARLIYPPGRAA